MKQKLRFHNNEILIEMEDSLIVSEAIKKSSRNRMTKYLDKMIGTKFFLKKKEKLLIEPLITTDVYSFIADQYRYKSEDSYTGYVVEFPFYDEEPKGVNVIYFEILSADIHEPLVPSDTPMTRDEIYVEIMPIFPPDYTELGFCDRNNLGVFFYKPFGILD